MSTITYGASCRNHAAGRCLQPHGAAKSQISSTRWRPAVSNSVHPAASVTLLVSQSPSVVGYTHDGGICDSVWVYHLQRCLSERTFIKVDADFNSVTVQSLKRSHFHPLSLVVMGTEKRTKALFADVQGIERCTRQLLNAAVNKHMCIRATAARFQTVNALCRRRLFGSNKQLVLTRLDEREAENDLLAWRKISGCTTNLAFFFFLLATKQQHW